MSKKIGIIAEDNSDIQVVEKIIEKFDPSNSFSLKKFAGNGCGKLKNKCDKWTINLFKQGCHHVIIFHDLDREAEPALRSLLSKKVPPARFPNSLIVIPIEELEAWLLTDSTAIRQALNLSTTPPLIHDCEAVPSPKEEISKIVYRIDKKKKYINTIHNSKIAAYISIENLARCNSFLPFKNYIEDRIV